MHITSIQVKLLPLMIKFVRLSVALVKNKAKAPRLTGVLLAKYYTII